MSPAADRPPDASGPMGEPGPPAAVLDRVLGDQPRAVTLLRGDLASGRVAHAYLFWGAAGSAPLRAARAFAAACVCERGGCGECAWCDRALRLVHPDVEVVEPAGMQLLVDQVREAVRAAWRVPGAGPRRVIVVDQADRMNPMAQNAFLKALEEPPPSTVIVLVAPSPEPLLPTVRSRCREVVFRPPTQEEVARELEREGVPPHEARVWARVGGTLERARALALDPGEAEGRRLLADRVLGGWRDPGDALDAAEWLASRTRAVRDRVAEAHRAEASAYADFLREARRGAEERLRREQRRAEQDALEAALDDAASLLRDLLAALADPEAPLLNEDLAPAIRTRAAELGPGRAPALVGCLGAVEDARRRLRANANVLLTLERLFLELGTRLR